MGPPLLSQATRAARAVSAAGLGLAGRTTLAGIDALLASRYTDELVRHVLASPAAERVTRETLEGPELQRVVDAALEGPGVERLVAQIMESRLPDAVIERLLEVENLWLLVDEIAQSPAVTEAIGQQTVGFVDEVAGQVRLGSQRADARLERVARRLARRKPPAGAPEGPR